MKDTGLNGYVYGFSVDYDATSVDDVKDIHKYLMKKNNYYFYNDMIDIKKFDSNLLKIYKNHIKT